MFPQNGRSKRTRHQKEVVPRPIGSCPAELKTAVDQLSCSRCVCAPMPVLLVLYLGTPEGRPSLHSRSYNKLSDWDTKDHRWPGDMSFSRSVYRRRSEYFSKDLSFLGHSGSHPSRCCPDFQEKKREREFIKSSFTLNFRSFLYILLKTFDKEM